MRPGMMAPSAFHSGEYAINLLHLVSALRGNSRALSACGEGISDKSEIRDRVRLQADSKELN
jgi:hypothetical protein